MECIWIRRGRSRVGSNQALRARQGNVLKEASVVPWFESCQKQNQEKWVPLCKMLAPAKCPAGISSSTLNTAAKRVMVEAFIGSWGTQELRAVTQVTPLAS